MAEGRTHEPFTGFVMMASCTSRLAFVSTKATMARTTGKRRMKSRAMPRGMRMIWEMMNHRLLYNGGFGSASLWSGSSHSLEPSLTSSAPDRGAASAVHDEWLSQRLVREAYRVEPCPSPRSYHEARCFQEAPERTSFLEKRRDGCEQVITRLLKPQRNCWMPRRYPSGDCTLQSVHMDLAAGVRGAGQPPIVDNI